MHKFWCLVTGSTEPVWTTQTLESLLPSWFSVYQLPSALRKCTSALLLWTTIDRFFGTMRKNELLDCSIFDSDIWVCMRVYEWGEKVHLGSVFVTFWKSLNSWLWWTHTLYIASSGSSYIVATCGRMWLINIWTWRLQLCVQVLIFKMSWRTWYFRHQQQQYFKVFAFCIRDCKLQKSPHAWKCMWMIEFASIIALLLTVAFVTI